MFQKEGIAVVLIEPHDQARANLLVAVKMPGVLFAVGLLSVANQGAVFRAVPEAQVAAQLGGKFKPVLVNNVSAKDLLRHFSGYCLCIPP